MSTPALSTVAFTLVVLPDILEFPAFPITEFLLSQHVVLALVP